MKFEKALSNCMQICSRKECCKWDILQKLQKWEVEDNDIDKIITQLEQDKFIDEKRYAQAFANDKFKFNKWGRIKIRYQLKQKQISTENINSALANINEDNYKQLIINEIQKKQQKVKAKSDYERKQKVIAYLSSKGFEMDLAFDLYTDD